MCNIIIILLRRQQAPVLGRRSHGAANICPLTTSCMPLPQVKRFLGYAPDPVILSYLGLWALALSPLLSDGQPGPHLTEIGLNACLTDWEKSLFLSDLLRRT